MTRRALIAGLMFLVIGLLPHAVLAQVAVPCTGCPPVSSPAYPEAGGWYNPEETSSGFFLEVQNGHLAGTYYGYDETGQPIWLLFSGALQREETGSGSAYWSLESELLRFEGGACIDCVFEGPAQHQAVGTIQFEFEQRNFARFRVGEGEWKPVWTLTYGTAAASQFPGVSGYPLPDLNGSWIFVFRDTTWFDERSSRILVPIQLTRNNNFPSRLRYGLLDYHGTNLLVKGEMECHANLERDGLSIEGPICELRYSLGGGNYWDFYLPLADIGDARFKGETLDGQWALQAFRADYD